VNEGLAQKKTGPLPVESLLAIKPFPNRSGVSLSPDGEWVAYTLDNTKAKYEPVSDKNREYTSTGVSRGDGVVQGEVWISNTKTGEAKNLSAEQSSSWSPVWSPDGKRLAFYSDRAGQANLWIWERATGETKKLSDAVVRPFFLNQLARWSPDGRKILCNILPEGMTLAAVNESLSPAALSRATQPTSQVNDNPPGIFVMRSSAKLRQAEPSASSNEIVFRPFIKRYLSDLAVVELESGRVERVARNVTPLGYMFSPDGRQIAFTVIKGSRPNSHRALWDLLIYSFDDRSTHVAAADFGSSAGREFNWSPDGTLIGYMTEGHGEKVECFVVRARGGTPRRLGGEDVPSLNPRPPLWSKNSKTLYLLGGDALWKADVVSGKATEAAKIPARRITGIVTGAGGEELRSLDNGQFLITTTIDSETKQNGFYRIDLETGAVVKLREENKRYGPINTFDVSANGHTFVYRAEDVQTAPELWVTSQDFQSPRQVTSTMGEASQYQLGESRLIEWRSTDGQRLGGALLLPAGYKEGNRYPLVVCVYGGESLSNDVNRFGGAFLGSYPVYNMQMLATRGYAVLFPDAPQRVGTPMNDLANTVLPGVNKAVELGIADPEQLAVTGHSYGSYSTLALLVQTNRFKAAAISGVLDGNLLSAYFKMPIDNSQTNIAWMEEGQGKMGGTPWQYRDRYIENSPVFYFERIQTPLLMVIGTEDISTTVDDANRNFIALRRLQKEVEYVRYEGEDHIIIRTPNVIDYWNRRIGWFDKYLKLHR
jgi:dipeptidyl aminopeptidase/acylaminoacyl peptidase